MKNVALCHNQYAKCFSLIFAIRKVLERNIVHNKSANVTSIRKLLQRDIFFTKSVTPYNFPYERRHSVTCSVRASSEPDIFYRKSNNVTFSIQKVSQRNIFNGNSIVA